MVIRYLISYLNQRYSLLKGLAMLVVNNKYERNIISFRLYVVI